MAEAGVKIYYDNKAILSGTSITISSESTAFPRANLRDPVPSKVWRSLSFWTIVAGFNDKIDFNRAGVKVATIAAGNYATGAALSIAIVNALEAADATPVWACSYSTTTFKFTISSDLAFTLLFGSGANAATDVALDIGFAEADTGSSTSQTGANAAYQSRHWVRFDLSSAFALSVAIACYHNVSAGGTIQVLAKTASDVWVSPGFGPQTLAFVATYGICRHTTFSQTFRYWLILITDVQNNVGYGELGVVSLAPALIPAKAYAYGDRQTREEISSLSVAIGGAHYLQERATRHGFSGRFEYFPRSQLTTFDTFATAVKTGKPFFFVNDDSVNNQTLLYVFNAEPIAFVAEGPERWSMDFTFLEFLG